jgi:hypothetical protein
MNIDGKPFVFLTRTVPGKPPILWVGEQKIDLDSATALHWYKELHEFLMETLSGAHK